MKEESEIALFEEITRIFYTFKQIPLQKYITFSMYILAFQNIPKNVHFLGGQGNDPPPPTPRPKRIYFLISFFGPLLQREQCM